MVLVSEFGNIYIETDNTRKAERLKELGYKELSVLDVPEVVKTSNKNESKKGVKKNARNKTTA